jgi:hypothetical protein
MTAKSIRAQVLEFLSTRSVKSGETVEFGWFIFRTAADTGSVDLETLDFRDLASFTSDFTHAEDIHGQQMSILASEKTPPLWCNLRHAAIVSRSYSPDCRNAFISRLDKQDANESGWYVGVEDDPLDVNDPANLFLQSLYELSIRDPRFLPYWLLPTGYRIQFDGVRATIERPK